MLGLFLASLMSIASVFTDVSRKKVLDDGHDTALVSFWSKLIAIIAYAIGMTVLFAFGTSPELPDIGKSFGISPVPAFFVYVSLNTIIEGSAILLTLRALQVAPISLCMPFMALTPLFLLPAGYFILNEPVTYGMAVGVALVVVGSLVVYRQLFAKGLFEPVKAIVREPGSRYMLIVAFLLTFTNLLDKFFVSSGANATFATSVSRSLTLSVGKTAMLLLLFIGLTISRMAKSNLDADGQQNSAGFSWFGVFRGAAVWLILAGVFEAAVLVLQLTAIQFAVAAVVISIKRAGIVLSVFLGWLIFRERGITDRAIAACVMLSGVMIFFLTKPDAKNETLLGIDGVIAVAIAVVIGLGIALYLTKGQTAEAGA
jgi:drug/metabolite transporter (DMT)-like permease